MPLTNSQTAYGTITKSFHWLIALLILAEIPLGLIATNLAHELELGTGTVDATRIATLFSLHKTMGVAVFLIALLRILWAISQPKPGLLNGDKPMEARLAELVHWLLYGSLVIVPLSGWVHHAAQPGFAPIWGPFGQSLPFVSASIRVAEIAETIHYLSTRLLMLSLVLHIAGAMKHAVLDRDGTLSRMWFCTRTPQPQPSAAQPSHVLPAGIAGAIFAVLLAVPILSADSSPSETAKSVAPPPSPMAEDTASDSAIPVWQMETGTIALTVTQFGSSVSGQFQEFTADISYDPEASPSDLAGMGQIDVTIPIASLTLGTVTDQAMGPDYFDATQFPQARVVATLVEEADGHIAKGTLTIKDQSVPLTMPFSLLIEGNRATVSASLTLNRLDFGIGASLPDESSLAHAVTVDISLTAERQ